MKKNPHIMVGIITLPSQTFAAESWYEFWTFSLPNVGIYQ